jgi:hypothetical protein
MYEIDNEITRYLGRRGQKVDAATEMLVRRAARFCREFSSPNYSARIFNSGELPFTMSGNAVKKYLEGAKKACFFAATLGTRIEKEISRAEYTDMPYSVVLDAAATQFIEEFCDKVMHEISEKVKSEGLFLKYRFSPGYGDLPLAQQPQFLRAAQADLIGLYCTENFILTPRKSVTALIGLFNEKQKNCGKCAACSMAKNCHMINYEI